MLFALIDDLHLYIYLYRTVFCPLLSVFRRVFYVTMCLFLLSSTILCLWIEIGFVYHFVICNISRIMLILDIHVSILLKDVTQCNARLLSTSPHKNQTNSDTWQFSEFNDFLCKYSFYYTIQALKEFMKSDYSCYGYLHFANSLATTGYSLTDCIKFSYFEGVKICLDEIKYWYEAFVKKIDCLFC